MKKISLFFFVMLLSCVTPPCRLLRKDCDNPPIEIQVVENRFCIARVGDTEEIKKQDMDGSIRNVTLIRNSATSDRKSLLYSCLRWYAIDPLEVKMWASYKKSNIPINIF
jgi:hypothetical protein